jgi:hypothetical protein
LQLASLKSLAKPASAVHVHPFLPLDARARVGIVGAEVHGVYPFKAEAEDSAKVPGYVRGVSDNSPGLEWTAQPQQEQKKVRNKQEG